MSIDQPTTSQNLIVVAIDVGTTYSGYAFSFRNKPSEVTVVNWENHANNGFSYKAPSVLLLNQTYQFVAFGYEAEKQYSDIITREPTDQYLFVKNFKTELVNDRVILCYQQILWHCRRLLTISFRRNHLHRRRFSDLNHLDRIYAFDRAVYNSSNCFEKCPPPPHC